MTGWRLKVEHSHHFRRDELLLYIGYRTGADTMQILNPVKLELGEVLEDGTNDVPEPIAIPRELAELLVEQLSYIILGVDDPIRECQRLRVELGQANRRLDALIAGIGRLGGQTP